MGGFIWNYSKCCCDFGICGFIFNSIVWSGLSLGCYIVSLCAFAGIFFQGRAHEEDPTDSTDDGDGWWDSDNDTWVSNVVNENDRLEVIWSVGGALIITGIVFTAIAISLASYQWAKDQMEEDEDKMEQAVEDAVRRVSNVRLQ